MVKKKSLYILAWKYWKIFGEVEKKLGAEQDAECMIFVKNTEEKIPIGLC